MAGRHRSPVYSFLQQLASSRPGSWLLSRVANRIDTIFLRASSGRTSLSTILTGLPVVVMTLVGARSGLPRTIPLAYIRDQQNPRQFAVVASNFGSLRHPSWYYNLKANPHVTCAIRGVRQAFLAHEASAEEYGRFWRYAEETYLGFPYYQQYAKTRHIPIMVLEPEKP